MPVMRDLDDQALKPGPAFAMTFMLCVISVAALMAYIPESYLAGWRDLTILITKGLGELLGLAMTRDADILTVNGFAMRIIGQCTAADYIAILATAMLLYTRHRFSYRLLGLAVAVPVVVFANACRLIISGVVGTFSRRAFDWIHDYLWVIAFALLIVAIWTLWVNGRLLVSRSAAWRVAQVTVLSVAAYALLLVFQDAHRDLMAHASSFLYALLNNDPQATIINDGNGMVYSRAGSRIYLDNMMEQANVAIYVGLMGPLQKKGDWEMLGMTVFGFVTIVLLGAIFIAIGSGLAVTSGTISLIGFQRIGSIVNLALPMTVYWIMASERGRNKLC